MDLLREKGRNALREIQAFDAGHETARIEFSRNNNGQISHRTETHTCLYCYDPDPSRNCSTLASPLPRPELLEDQINLLNLVTIQQPADLRLGIHREVFLGVFDAFKMEPYMLYLISRNIDGFYDFHEQIPEDEETICYFLHVRGSFMLMWSYVLETATTNAIMIARPAAVSVLEGEIGTSKALLGHPLSLAAICCGYLIDRVDREIGAEITIIASIEAKTGFNPFEGASIESESEEIMRRRNEDLGVLLGSMTGTGVALSMHLRYLGLIKRLVDAIKVEMLLENVWKQSIPKSYLDDFQAISKRIVVTIEMLIKAHDMTQPYIESMRERVEVQNTAIGHLIARQEYLTTMELGKDSESLAMAARYDSSSMKIIAILTIFFLPATFFAALFALPLLNWDDSPVIHKRFWVYLAFTFQSTAMIAVGFTLFSLWQGNERRKIEKNERNKIAESLSGISATSNDRHESESDEA